MKEDTGEETRVMMEIKAQREKKRSKLDFVKKGEAGGEQTSLLRKDKQGKTGKTDVSQGACNERRSRGEGKTMGPPLMKGKASG